MSYDIHPGAVINADCLTVLRQMEAGSVDMVITKLRINGRRTH